MFKLELNRYEKTKECTMGKLRLFSNNNLVFACYTLERPDYNNDGIANNEVRRSCIPEGVYTCKKRLSKIVAHSFASYKTDDIEMLEYLQEGWTFEVTEVKGRTNILMHPANYVHELQGCIATGTRFSGGKAGIEYSLVNSRTSFLLLSKWLKELDEIELTVTSPSSYYKQQS